jgi:hypothetical protein
LCPHLGLLVRQHRRLHLKQDAVRSRPPRSSSKDLRQDYPWRSALRCLDLCHLLHAPVLHDAGIRSRDCTELAHPLDRPVGDQSHVVSWRGS